MIRKDVLTLLFFFALTTGSFAQKNPSATLKPKFGKVDLSEFSIKGSGPDSAAAAVKIFDIGKGSFVYNDDGGYSYIFERQVRYKIISKQASDLANLEIVLYNNGKDNAEENLKSVSGATYNLVDHQIVISPMTKEAKFSSRLDEHHKVKRFTLPNVKEGSIIEYSYKTRSDFIFRLDDWYFQGDYPCEYSDFTINVPQYFIYKILKGGYIDIEQAKPIAIQDVQDGATMQSEFFASHIPAIKDESYITTLDDYTSKVGFELVTAQFPERVVQDFTSTWPKIVAQLIEHEQFGGFIRVNGGVREVVNSVIKDEPDTAARMALIFNYVKNTIKWNKEYNRYTTIGNQRSVLEKKSGNSAEINLLLFSMLKQAGVKVSPVLVSTRSNGRPPGYPILTKFNNVIVLAETGNQKHLLDATNENNRIDVPDFQNLNHKGLLIDLSAKDAAWISTEPAHTSKRSVSYTLRLDSTNQLKGKLFIATNNYKAQQERNSYSSWSDNEISAYYKTGKPGLEVSNYTINNADEQDDMLDETMDITIGDNIEQAGNLIYFTPLLYDRIKENPFKLEGRKFPVDFAYPQEDIYNIVVEFPKNYIPKKLPANEKINLPENAGSFTMIYEIKDNELHVSSRISILKSIFNAEEYYDLQELYKNIVRKQSEQILFTKTP